MAAGSVKEHAEHIIPTIDPKLSLLKSAVIYGANASGKSNLIKALRFMKDFVRNSSKESQIDEPIHVRKYLFSTDTDNMPSIFEIVFMTNDVFYKYGFEIDSGKVSKEYLYAYPKKRERIYFIRDDAGIDVKGHFSEGKGLEKKTRPNALFLSVCAQNNGAISGDILKWFSTIDFLDNMNFLSSVISDYPLDKLYGNVKKYMLKLIGIADLQINNIIFENKGSIKFELRNDSSEELQESIVRNDIFVQSEKALYKQSTFHTKYNDKNIPEKDVTLSLDYESEGTQKIIKYSVPIIEKLLKGGILIIDDMDAMLHTIISKELVKLFNNNGKNAQFVIATHDVILLDKKYFRKDQVWFTEKDQYGATDIYSLIEFKIDKKNDEHYERDYIKGRYGAIPFLVDFSKLFAED